MRPMRLAAPLRSASPSASETTPDRVLDVQFVLVPFFNRGYHRLMTNESGPMTVPAQHLKPASRDELANALAFALRFEGRKRVHNADEIMAEIVAKRLVEHLERAGFVVMKRPPIIGAAAIARGHEG